MHGGKSKEQTRILVVEDEAHLAIGIRYNLEAEGFDVTVVEDGRSALEVVEKSPRQIDLVILDLMLPGMSGYAVCETIRANGEDMPILILSARTLSEDRKRGFDVGADQYMMKPFDLDEFISRVKNLLAARNRREQSRSREEPEAMRQYEFSNVKIDFDSFQVSIGDKTVRLTQLEAKLLRYFCQNEGRIIPRNELLTEVWEMSPNIITRAPDQFILRLRKLFERDPSNPQHFITIRDAGYQFLASGTPEGEQSAEAEETLPEEPSTD
ncbi:response regulator transcription factor [Blastopirellula sp. JC732]|uniref:Response regulator transcription factor n=1 Tax=Blastopirellula sediminis TaxID=2894196 RepID=A0A9X1SFG6_9BACT|nr:response regulator transcription factor [Blastopirellula sediminis]MCC9607731.1 response regulator transcription factor [Blastopirellula sediminis]MCC9627476.1 response regulator transcription factor [Blastopirellula sediminis]